MEYKTKSSPLNQFGSFGRSGNTQSQQNMFAGGLSTAMSTGAKSISVPQPTAISPRPMMPTPINPKAVGNPMTVQGIYGNANDNTFTRTVQGNEAPMMQLANPGMLQDGPQLPPEAVQTSVTPTLGFENS
jgi:hypothetical protein